MSLTDRVLRAWPALPVPRRYELIGEMLRRPDNGVQVEGTPDLTGDFVVTGVGSSEGASRHAAHQHAHGHGEGCVSGLTLDLGRPRTTTAASGVWPAAHGRFLVEILRTLGVRARVRATPSPHRL